MKLEPFMMERMQSTWENLVDYNLSESGVHPVSLTELAGMEPGLLEQLVQTELGYGQSNGTIELRERIAVLYAGATADHVLVTNGTSEANFVTIWKLVDKDDEIALMLPNYMQIWGISRAFGGIVRPFYLREENDWHPDLDELRKIVGPRTKLIAVCNPNNPTGRVLNEAEMNGIAQIADKCGAWLLVDEVYQGAERLKERTPSFWGRCERLIVTNGLSKAYGLPGLRIGWILAPTGFVSSAWSYHDYMTIGPGMLSDVLARVALLPRIREKILQRTRGILQNNYPILENWIHAHGDVFSLKEPDAGAIAYLRYKLDINSTELVERLLHEKSTLIVPGDHFGMDHYLRIGYGPPASYLQSGLERIHSTLVELAD
jgi:aspartate/methionine/tyrosine aminotransferase